MSHAQCGIIEHFTTGKHFFSLRQILFFLENNYENYKLQKTTRYKNMGIKTWSKSRWNYERDYYCNKSDYILINLI